MTLEFRPTGVPHCFDLHEGEDCIGKVEYTSSAYDGDAGHWYVELWSLMGTGKTWTANPESHEQAVQWARELYEEEFVAERRELKRPVPGVRTINVPMGGQRRG